MVNNTTPDGCTIVVAKLFERINDGRKMRSLPPVEKSAMTSRCNLRFNLDKKRGIDFNQEEVVIAAEDVEALELLVNEQFDCNLDGIVKKLCVKPTVPQSVKSDAPPVLPESTQEHQKQTGTEAGLMSKIKKIFG